MAVELWHKIDPENGGFTFFGSFDVEPRDLIQDPLCVIKDLPTLENIYYTLTETKRRKEFIRAKYFMFDIDGLDLNQPVEDTARVAVMALGLAWDETMVVCSGNGLQIVIEMDNWVTEESWFKERKQAYVQRCETIDKALLAQGLQGKCDRNVFDSKRLARVPNTQNVKVKNKHRTQKNAYTIQGDSKPIDFDFGAIEPEVVEDRGTYNWDREVDVDAIISEAGCLALREASLNQAEVPEPLWFKLLGIIAACPPKLWPELCQKLFGSYPGYDYPENETKLLQWRDQDGPVTCEAISLVYDKCHLCPHNGKVRRPSDIESDTFIRTEKTGFRFLTQDGQPGKIDYEGLCKYYKKKKGLVVTEERELVFSWTGTHWVRAFDSRIKAFALHNVKPAPSVYQCTQFEKTIKLLNIKSETFFRTNGYGKINFKNGVLDTRTREVLSHSKKYGFNYCIPFEVKQDATSPKFKEYLLNLMSGDEDLTTLVMEYIGYVLSGDTPWVQKAMMFDGSGANGKSALITLIQEAVGFENTAFISLRKFQDEQSLANLEGKLLNVSTENEASAFRKGTEVFKSLVAGEPIEVKEVFVKKGFIQPFAKHIFACNEIPYSYDNSYGFNRRLFLIPFKKTFRKDANVNILTEMRPEIPGMIMDCLELYLKAKERGEFTTAQASVDLGKQYETDNSPIKRFIEDEIEIAPEMHVTRTQLYDRFIAMCEDEQIRPFGKTRFLKDLRKQFPGDLVEKQIREHGKRVRVFEGISLISEDDGRKF